MGKNENIPPPRIHKSVRVGVSGHRDLPPEMLPEIEKEVRGILERIQKLLETMRPPVEIKSLFSEDPALLRVISPLAQGADQVVAQEALALGYTLCAPLPFPKSVYRQDFSDDPQAGQRFDELLGRATAVVELDGERGARDPRHSAYEAVGRMVLESSDILIAIWDGEDPHGRGGTGQIAREAIASQVMVVVVPPGRPSEAEIRTSDAQGQSLTLGLGELERELGNILFPGWQAPGADEDVQEQMEDYRDFASEKPLEKRWTRKFLVGRIWAGIWSVFKRFYMAFCKHPAGEWPEPPPVEVPGVDAGPVRSHYSLHYRWASRLARFYAALYRTSFLANYLLAALAVTLVLLAHAIPSCERGFLIAELACIVMILIVYFIAQKKRWHERYVDYRILAEQLRLMKSLALLGLAVPATRPPAHAAKQGDLTGSWVNWHFRAILREVLMLGASYSPAYRRACLNVLIGEVVRPQMTFHTKAQVEARCGQRFCRGLIVGLFTLTAIACTLHIVPLLGDLRVAPETLHGAIPWLTVLAACLPAWAAAFHGVAGQAEFERLGNRSDSMATYLNLLAGRLEKMVEAQDVPNSSRVWRMGRFTSDVMISEVVDWRVFYMAGEIPTT